MGRKPIEKTEEITDDNETHQPITNEVNDEVNNEDKQGEVNMGIKKYKIVAHIENDYPKNSLNNIYVGEDFNKDENYERAKAGDSGFYEGTITKQAKEFIVNDIALARLKEYHWCIIDSEELV